MSVLLVRPEAVAMLGIAGVLWFIAVWCAVCYLLSLIGGWHTLAASWRTQDVFAGPKQSFCSGEMRWRWLVGYNGVLTLGSNMHGLSLSVFAPFRVGHPPLFILWTAIRIAPNRKGLLFKRIGLVLDEQAAITLWLFPGTAQKLLARQTLLGPRPSVSAARHGHLAEMR